MATIELTTPARGFYRFGYRTEIEDVFYRFIFHWNQRDLSWYLDIGDDANVAIVRGIRLVLGEEKLRPFKAYAVPQGNLRVRDTTEQHREVSGSDPWELGERVLLEYDEVG